MMQQTWRWFGPNDQISLGDINQAGAEGIVTALYHLPSGTVWEAAEIEKRLAEICAAGNGLGWDVVESLPVTEAIRLAAPGSEADTASWIQSMRNLAAAGIKTICYNFMPVLDWTRTDLKAPQPSGALALRFDLVRLAVFDIHILQRKNAADDYASDVCSASEATAHKLTEAQRQDLAANIIAGLPGAVEGWTLESFRHQLAAYDGLTADDLRNNLLRFLEAVVPEAEKLGVRLCCHPDDPPWPILGLPRIMSTEADYCWLVEAVPSASNGITFCTGSLGARHDNDLPGFVKRLGPHIHFVHLRNVRRETEQVPCSFFEDSHLEGSSDMVAVIKALYGEECRRRSAGRSDWRIPMRPDHGQELIHDQHQNNTPGYPLIGRLKGLAELRGIMVALEHTA